MIPFHLAESGRDLGGGFVVTVYVDADSPAGEVPRAFVDLNTMLELLDRLSECRLQLSNATAVIESARAVVGQAARDQHTLTQHLQEASCLAGVLSTDKRLTDSERQYMTEKAALYKAAAQ